MAEPWSPEEAAATVADYFEMLNLELRNEPYSKKEHNRRLQQVLGSRTGPAIEFKHTNISAILLEYNFPYIAGYQPRRNYQELLRDLVIGELDRQPRVIEAAEQVIRAQAVVQTQIPALEDVFTEPPKRDRDRTVGKAAAPFVPLRTNYLEREARNASLGEAGERFVMEVESRRLRASGNSRLADQIEHVSRTRGDGPGYDIASFEIDGRERLIEVKTTNFGSMTPFYASSREATVSETRSDVYHLYRVFEFRASPRIFALRGSLSRACILDPIQYRASLR